MQSKNPPTLRAVARCAGVSLGTVSLALRDHPQTSSKTRARVKAIAARMGYRPDPQIAKLMSYLQRRKRRAAEGTLAFLTAFATADVWRESETWTNYYEGAAARAAELGYRLEHFWLRAPGSTERRLSQILHARGIEGLLIAPVPHSQQRMHLEWERFSTVAFGYSLQEPRVHRVMHNHFHTLTLATTKLRERGYERIGLVIGPDHDERVMNRWSAAFLTFQHVVDPTHAVPLHRGAIEPRALRCWFEAHRPDAIIGDQLAVVDALDACGYRVPGDYAFAILDSLQRTRPFAGIDQCSREIGAAAAGYLVGLLQRDAFGLPARPETLMIEGNWVEGDSVPAERAAAGAIPPLKPAFLDRTAWD